MYTFDDYRVELSRIRGESSPLLRAVRFFNNSDWPIAFVDRMIAVIDAMTPEERKLGNELQLSPKREQELAELAGTSTRDVQCVIVGRRSSKFAGHAYVTRD
jgi:Signal peptide binding domain